MHTIDEGKDKDVASCWTGIKNQAPDEDLPVKSAEEPVVLDLQQEVKKCSKTFFTQMLHKSICPALLPKVFRTDQRKKIHTDDSILRNSCSPWLFY